MEENNEVINNWLASGKVGPSSNAIIIKLSGINICKPWELSAPHNPADFESCLKLLIAVPAFKSHLHKMKEVSPLWNQVIVHWDELERLYHEECRTGTYSKFYNRMKSIGC